MPSVVFAVSCRLYPSVCSRCPTVEALTGWPRAVRVVARARNDNVVQRKGETGSPRVCGSISDSSAGSRPESVSTSGLRPAPGARIRGVGEEQSANSAIPRAMVAVLVPEASATRVIPPWPMAVASLARYNRRRRSSKCGRT
jgi:hypothetical protein